MESMPGRCPISLLYPGLTSSDAQPAFSIRHSDSRRECVETDPMSKAWIEYQQSRSGHGSLKGLSTPLWPAEEPFQRKISRGSENPEREESPALQRIDIPSGKKHVREEAKQNSIDTMEKRKSMEDKINDITKNNQHLFKRLKELDKCEETFGNQEIFIHIADSAEQTDENTTPNVDRQVFQEERESLLQKNKDLETELVSLKQEVEKRDQELKRSNSEVANLQNINLNLEKQLNSVKVLEDKEVMLNGCEQRKLCKNSEDNSINESQCSMDASVGKQEEKAETRDKNLCSYSQKQLKELLEKVDAATNKNSEEREVLTADTVPDITKPDNIQFQKFVSSITQCCVDDKNESTSGPEVKSTEEFEISRLEKNESDVVENQITSESSSSNHNLLPSSRSDSHVSLTSEDPCKHCNKKASEKRLNNNENIDPTGQDSKLPLLREERNPVAQLLNCTNSNNGQTEHNPCMSEDDASPSSVLDQIVVQSKTMLYDNIKLYEMVFQLKEGLLAQRVGTAGGNVSENNNNKDNPSKQNIAQISLKLDSQSEHHIKKIDEELETLESFLIGKEEKSEECEPLKKSGECTRDLQEHVQHLSTISSLIDVPEKKTNVTQPIAKLNGSCTYLSIEELSAFKEEAELTEQSLRKTILELEASLNETQAEILTLKHMNDKVNIEKNAALVALEETKTGLAKASNNVVNLAKDLKNEKEERNKLSAALKKVCDSFKEEQEEKKDLQDKLKVSQEAIAYTKIELQTVRAVLEKEKEARRIAKERERAVQEVLDEARQSRERLAMELKMLIDYREKWHGQSSLQTCPLNQEDELKLRKLGEIVEKLNCSVAEKVASHVEKLKDFFVWKEETASLREENGSLKAKITQLSRRLNLNREEKRKLFLEVQRLHSVLSSLPSNQSITDLGKPESLEQLNPESERKQKDRSSKKSLRRRFSGRSTSSGNEGNNNSSSSKDLQPDQDKRMSRLENELALLRDEFHCHSMASDDMCQDSPQSSSNDSEESETSELNFSQEKKQPSVGNEVAASLIRGIQELEQEFKIDSELQELKETLTAVIESTKNKLNTSNHQIRRITEELETKDKILKSVQAELSSLEAKNEYFKKEMKTLQDELDRERYRNVDSIERQRYLDQALKKALKSKAEMEYVNSVKHSEDSLEVDRNNNKNIATKKDVEEFRCVLQSIYDPSGKHEIEIRRLKQELIRKTEEMKLLKKDKKNYSSTELNKNLASLQMKLNPIQNEQKSLKETQYHKDYENTNLNYRNNQKRRNCNEKEANGKCEYEYNTTKKESECRELPQLKTKLLKLKSDLNVEQQEKMHLESRLSFLTSASKSFEADIYSLKEELEREIASKCAYIYREARLQETLSKYKEEIERLTNELQRLYKKVKISEKKYQLNLSTENENLDCTSPNFTVENENTQVLLHEMSNQLQDKPNQYTQELTKDKERREKAERELSLQKELSGKREKQQTEIIEKLREDLTRNEDKLKLMMKKSMEDQTRNKEVFQNLKKALEDKMKAEEEAFKKENQIRGVVKELEETKRTLHSFISAATASKDDQKVWENLKLFEEERKSLNQQLTICEKNRKKIEEQNKDEMKKLKEKVKVLEHCLTIAEEEGKKLQDENKKVEEEARKLSEQVSEEVENVRNESREIEADLQNRIEKLQTELKISKEQVAEGTEHLKTVCEECKNITREHEKCKTIIDEFNLLKKEHESCRKTLTESERLRTTCNNLSDKISVLSKELIEAEKENIKQKKSNLALRQTSTVLYIEVITLKAQLEIMRAEKVKPIKTAKRFQYLHHNVSSSYRCLESDASKDQEAAAMATGKYSCATHCDQNIAETAVSENE